MKRRLFHRAEPAGFTLQPRDEGALRLLSDLRYLTADQFVRAGIYSNPKVCQRRLRPMFDLGLLSRLALPDGFQRRTVVYALGPSGAAHLAERGGVSLTDFGFRPSKELQRDTLFLQHWLLTNELYIRLERALAVLGGEVGWYRDERKLKADRFNDEKAPVIPDGLMALGIGGKHAHFALELVRTSPDPQPWRRKVAGYHDWISAGLYQREYGHPAPTVLTVTASHNLRLVKRLAGWTLAEAKDTGADPTMFLFTTMNHVTHGDPISAYRIRNPETILSDPIWLQPGAGLRSLMPGSNHEARKQSFEPEGQFRSENDSTIKSRPVWG